MQTLIDAGLQVFPCWLRFNPAKNKYEKGPSIPKGVSWQTVDPRDPSLDWSSGTVGVAVPPGIVILDLDTQKGVTRQDVEQFLGTPLDWERAHIQNTPSGGSHYAFRTGYDVHQRSDWIQGFDTRTAGRGFICAGNMYEGAGMFGVMALTQPACLPELPWGLPIAEQARTVEAAPMPSAETRDDETIIGALHHIDPTSRSEWWTVGCGLSHYYHDDRERGFAIFDAWSRGEYWRDGCPESYNAETQEQQWHSMKPSKGGREITIGSVFHMAVQGGWVPPRNLDTAAAFGAGSAPAAQYDTVVDAIQSIGGNPKEAEAVVGQIQALGGSPLQRAMLAALLRRQLKEDALLTKELGTIIDAMIGTRTDGGEGGQVQGMYGKNQTHNALVFLDKCYPDATLVRVAQQWYSYNGKIWVARDDDDIAHEVTRELIPVAPSNSQISGTVSILQRMAHRADLVLGDIPPEVVILQNGVLNINTLELFPHDKSLFTTNILPYSYNPYAQCPNWQAFLYDITGQDGQVVDLLQEWLGYLMSNDYSHQKVMMMVGPKRCGKGTIGQIINQLVGDENFTGGDIEALTDNKYLETLPTKTVMFDGDVKKSFTRHIAESITGKLKAISGRDKITVPRLYKSPLNVRLPTRFTIAGNNIPRLFDDSGALASRMLLVPFYKSYYNREDHSLFDKLLAEIEGIAVWALSGLMRLNSQGRFTVPDVSKQEAEDMSEQYSPLKRFAAECVTLGNPDTFTEGGDLYESYKVWALAAGEDNLLPRRVFTASFKDLTRGEGVKYCVKWHNGASARGFTGVALVSEAGSSVGRAAFGGVKA